MKINSARAFVLYVAALLVAYASNIVWPAADFLAFATQLTVGFGAYMTKRHMDKRIPPPGGTNE